MHCVETIDLVHKFSEKETALNGVNLRLIENTIYGFLGPNGAGKTTTLRLILGLLKRQQGNISVFGKTFENNRVEILSKIGSMIETPSLYGHLTAVENLKILQKVYGCAKDRIGFVLELVDLTSTKNKKAGQFSLGMKQRLGIAMALLHDPTLLILDEPTNGLDPNGILEIRELLKNLNQNHGITILISSHLLSEIEKLVTHVGIINRGNMLFQGTLPELVARQMQSSYIEFETSDNTKSAQIIKDFGVVSRINDGKIATPIIDKTKVAAINRLLVQSDIEVYQVSKIESDLERIFFDVIAE